MNKGFKIITYSSMMLVALGLSAGVAFADETGTTNTNVETTETSTITTETSSDKTEATSTETTESTSSEESATESSSDSSEKQIAGQTFHIQKILSQDELTDGTEQAVSEGVDGAHFNVYDITDLYKEAAEQDNTASIEDVQSELTERANKLDLSSKKVVAEGNTATIKGKSGVFEFKTQPTTEAHQAFYVVNDTVPEETATISDSFVIVTPVADDNGEVLSDVWIYPKSKPVDPKKEVKKIVSTGTSENVFQKFVRFISDLF